MTPGDEAPLTSDPAPSFVDLPEGRLAFTDEGPRDAPALVTFPGVPGTGRDFRYLAPHLTEHVRMVRLDPPGFGKSAPAESAVRSFAGRARVVRDLADRLRLDRFAILGHSMGGGTAITLAAEVPERISLLVLVASVGLRRHRGLGFTPRQFARVAALLRVPVIRGALLPSVRRQYRRRGFPGVDSLSAADLARHMRAIAAADFDLIRRSIDAGLPRTLLAYAEDDHLVETSISAELAVAIPHARVLRFSEGGHNLQKTRAVELASAIKDALLA